jgi:polysaccharide biosynthesis protein PslG
VAIDDGGDEGPKFPGTQVGVSPQTGLDEDDFDNMEAAGVGVLRLPVNWEAVQLTPEGDCEPEPAINTCDWGPTDIVVGNAAEHGIRVLPILSNVPGFVAEDHNTPPLEGYAQAGWADFLKAVVERYGPGGAFWGGEFAADGGPFDGQPQPITEWQIWNEPNGKRYFRPRPDPERYAELVEISSEAIRGVDPSARIILAGMFGTSRIPLPEFLRGMYGVDGIEDHFDAIALHPYSSGLGQLKLQIRWARREARRAGDADVGLWLTELGWGSGEGPHPLAKGEAGQADLLTEAFELLARRREAWNIEGVVWFTWKDRGDDGVCRFCRDAGLFDASGAPKPAWDAFQGAIAAGS